MTQHAQGLREAITSRGTREGEIWNRRKNGEIFPEVLVITAIRDDHGGVTHYIGIFRDIILRKERQPSPAPLPPLPPNRPALRRPFPGSPGSLDPPSPPLGATRRLTGHRS